MTIQITDLSDLDQTLVAQNLEEITQRLQEEHPELVLRRGVFRDTLAGFHAELSTAEQVTFDRYLSARSLRQIELDPTLADENVTDDVLSNYRVLRREGEFATGEVTIVVSSSNRVTISSGAIFEADGKQFAADQVFTAKIEAAQINNPGDRLLTQLSDGNFAFTIDTTAVEEGTDSLLSKDTTLVPLAPPPDFVRSYATNDFVDGRNVETNTDLLLRFQEGVACKAPSNRTNMKAMLKELDDEAFKNVVRVSVVGLGEPEMLRDQHTIFPMSFGGRSDWWVRTQERLLRTSLERTATLIAKNDVGDGVWQFGIGRDDAPGFYEVGDIRPQNFGEAQGGFTIVADVRSNDLTGDVVPDIETVAEGAYSRYQTAVIQFTDDVTDHSGLSIGDTQVYDAEIRQLPLIGDIQDELLTRNNRAYGADTLVRAPVPCFLQLSFTIFKQNNQDDPDLEAIINALVDEVHGVDFIGRLYASQLHDVIHGFLSENMSAGKVDMFGRLRHPDGTRRFVRDSEVLEIDEPAEEQVSPRTVQFFVDPGDVLISISTDIPVPQ